MATDTLEIFGDEFTNVAGIKATDDNDQIKVYIRPQGTKSISANGTSIDVTEYASVDVAVPSSTPTLQTITKSYTPTESQQTETITASSGYDGIEEVDVTVGAISSTYVGTGITRRSSSDLQAWDDVIVVPSGYYAQQEEKSVGYTSVATPIATKGTVSNHTVSVTPSITQPRGYVDAKTKTGTAVTVSASELVSGTYSVTSSGTKDVTNYASASVPSGTEGTPTATKGTVSNHAISVTPSVTNTAGYISGGTINGTAVTVSASELVSGSDTVTTNDTYDVTNLAEIVVNVSGGGGVTVTDEANATGITCVITSGGSPTPSGIPLNTELIDFTKLTEDYTINSSGEAVSAQWYCASDYTAVDPSMTFSYTGCRWYYIGVYDSSKEVLRTIYIYNDGTVDSDNTNLANGTLSGSELTGASYVRITGVAVQSQYRLSLIRTA